MEGEKHGEIEKRKVKVSHNSMQEDAFPAAEKILSDVENVFKKDPHLVSFEIIPADDNENKSPVFHDENSLGLASWCIKPLYCYVYNRLLDLKHNQHRREEPTVVARWLLGALLLNPDVSTFWNMRREFLRNGRLDPLEDLRFVNIVLYYKAKCFEAFSYRRWILKLLLTESKESTYNPDTLFHNEFQITSVAADRYGNNCHAWSHRKHVLSMLEALSTPEFNAFLDKEWEESNKWCSRHVSDYSGLTYRQFLLKKILLRERRFDQPNFTSEFLSKRREIVLEFVKTAARCNDVFLLQNGSCKEVLNLLHGANATKSSEMKFEQMLINLSHWAEDCVTNEELINTFPGHEALWYHRRYLAFALLALNRSYGDFFSYDCRSFDLTKMTDTLMAKSKISRSGLMSERSSGNLLEIAFSLRNKDLIDMAKQYGNHHNRLAEKFFNFLSCMKLEP